MDLSIDSARPAFDATSPTVTGGDGNDTLTAGPGVLTLDGGPGDDLLIVTAPGPHTLIGGAGHDRFEIAAASRPGFGEDVRILDWTAGERLTFDHLGHQDVRPGAYAEIYARSYLDAEVSANALIGRGAAYVAVQVGHDVVVFAETDGNRYDGADAAVVLVGKTLSDVDYGSFL